MATPRGRHARGKHAKPPLVSRIVIGLAVLLLLVTLGPALIAVGIFIGILGAWLSRGLTKS